MANSASFNRSSLPDFDIEKWWATHQDDPAPRCAPCRYAKPMFMQGQTLKSLTEKGTGGRFISAGRKGVK